MLVADANVFVAVAVNEPAKSWIIRVTSGQAVIAPLSLPFEIGNAVIALYKRRLLAAGHIASTYAAATTIPVELREIDIKAALELSTKLSLYAYDGYMLQCALEARVSLLTLDKKLRRAARDCGVEILE